MSKKKKKVSVLKRPRTIHWHELTHYFKLTEQRAFSLKGHDDKRMFLQGTVNDVLVICVDPSTPQEVMRELHIALEAHSLPALVVSAGMEFMRLRPCSAEEEQVLNDAAKGRRIITIAAPTESEPGSGVPVDGIQPDGAGVEADPGDGIDPDGQVAPEAAGEGDGRQPEADAGDIGSALEPDAEAQPGSDNGGSVQPTT